MAKSGLNKFEVIGAKEIQRMMMEITPRQMKRAHINAMKASGKIIEKEISNNLSSDFPNIPKTKHISPSTKKQSPSHKEIVTYAGWSEAENDFYFKNAVKPKGMLKWFAIGTKKRPNNDNGGEKRVIPIKDKMMSIGAFNQYVRADNTGQITGKDFVKRARESKGQEAIRVLDDNINKAIQYQWNRRK